MINVCVLYQKKLFADGLKSLIADKDRYRLLEMRQIGKNHQYPNEIKDDSIDLFIIELDWPRNFTNILFKKIKTTHPTSKTLLVSNLANIPAMFDLINNDLNGFISKNNNKDDLQKAISQIIEGEGYFSSHVTKVLLEHLKSPKRGISSSLTRREKQVLELITQMHSNNEIAEQLSISRTTVKTHRQNIMKKFGTHNLLSLIRYACRENFLHNDNNGFCNNCPHKIEIF